MSFRQTLPEGLDILTFVQIDSTNDEVRRQADAGALGPLWVRAEAQTKGRGRRGNIWLTAKGNLFMSGLITLDKTPVQAANLSFVAALAVAQAIEAFVPADLVRLKWPNDVLIDGHKTSGILLESWTSPAGLHIAIGIGVNVQTSPDNVAQKITCVSDHCTRNVADCTAENLFLAVTRAFHELLDQWQEQGFSPIKAAWTARAWGLGQAIKVNLANQSLNGTFAGLDDTGALRLETPDGGMRPISAGEVFFGV